MLSFICRNFPNARSAVRISSLHRLRFLQINNVPLYASSATLRFISNTSDTSSFAASYLVNKYGFPPERALSVSKKYLHFETPEQPESVVAFFEKHGFSKTQITSMVRKTPPILMSHPEKTYLPKLEFLLSKGLSSTEVAKIVSMSPGILKISLENQIKPAFDYFKNVLKSEEKVIFTIKRFGSLLAYDHQAYLAVNLDTLRGAGVPESNIAFAFAHYPRSFTIIAHRFEEIVGEVRKMGFNPEKLEFVTAIYALRAMSKSTWNKKVEAYKKWGWSDDDIAMAFRKYPECMTASEDKIEKTMDYVVNKMGWDSSEIARRPILMSLSLEKRIIPRCLVYQFLLSKGLIKKDMSANALLGPPENTFLNKFLKRYEQEVPELLKIYQGKLALPS